MTLYLFTGIGCVGKKAIMASLYSILKASPRYVFARLVSSRGPIAPLAGSVSASSAGDSSSSSSGSANSDVAGPGSDAVFSNRVDIDPMFEAAVSDEEFRGLVEQGLLVHTWSEGKADGKEARGDQRGATARDTATAGGSGSSGSGSTGGAGSGSGGSALATSGAAGSASSAAQWGVPVSVTHALADGRTVFLLVPSGVREDTAATIESVIGAAYPVKTVVVTASLATVLARLRAEPRLLFTSSAVGAGTLPNRPASSTGGAKERAAAAAAAAGSSGSAAGAGAAAAGAPGLGRRLSSATTKGTAAGSGSSSSTSSGAGIDLASLAAGYHAMAASAASLLAGSKLEERLGAAKKKLTKMQADSEPLPSSALVLDNEKPVDQTVAVFLEATGIRADPSASAASASSSPLAAAAAGSAGESDETADLATCSAQEYLKRTVLPYVLPALQTVEALRPSDPVEYLALCILQRSEQEATLLKQLQAIRRAEQGVRDSLAEAQVENAEVGRI